MALVKSEDQVYRSKIGFFFVWKLTNDFGIYNADGGKVATVHGHGQRKQRMAELMADAIENEFQR